MLRMHKLVANADISENKVICGALTTWTCRTQELAAVTCRNCLRLLAKRADPPGSHRDATGELVIPSSGEAKP
jgi:hypothetical protein